MAVAQKSKTNLQRNLQRGPDDEGALSWPMVHILWKHNFTASETAPKEAAFPGPSTWQNPVTSQGIDLGCPVTLHGPIKSWARFWVSPRTVAISELCSIKFQLPATFTVFLFSSTPSSCPITPWVWTVTQKLLSVSRSYYCLLSVNWTLRLHLPPTHWWT